MPGSGKTTVLTARIARLISEGTPPDRLLTLTFSRGTARDMKARYIRLFGPLELGVPTFSTIHSFCYTVLNDYAQTFNRPMPHLIESTPGRKQQILREAAQSAGAGSFSKDALEDLEQAVSRAKNVMQPLEPSHSGAAIQTAYEQYKRDRRLMDFDDMLSLALDIFQRFPAIEARFQSRYDYVHVDEAQDTSPLQHRILERLAKSASMFMVGDEDQSIYGFRGADPEELLQFEARYPGGQVLKMEENFRSGPELVRRADAFIGQNQTRYEKRMISASARETQVEALPREGTARQYRRIVRLLQQLPEGKTAAVLYRNNLSALPLLDLFERNGLTCVMREYPPDFLDSGPPQDIFAYADLARDPTDVNAFRRIRSKMGISNGLYEHFRTAYQGGDLFECLQRIDRRGLAAYYAERLPALLKMSPAQALHEILHRMHYLEYLNLSVLSSSVRPLSLQKIDILRCIGADLSNLDALKARLLKLEQSIRDGKYTSPASPITLATLHSSKGMEFDWVFLADALDGLLPAADSPIESEVRLFYVGATRARERLYLCRPHTPELSCSPFIRSFLKVKTSKAPPPSLCQGD